MLRAAPLQQAQEVRRQPEAAHTWTNATGMALDEAIARALGAGAVASRGRAADIEVARGQRQQAGLRPNPDADLRAARRNREGPTVRRRVGVEWPLDLFRVGARATAERELAATRFAVADRERAAGRGRADCNTAIAAAAVRELSVADDLVATPQRQFDLLRRASSEGAIAAARARSAGGRAAAARGRARARRWPCRRGDPSA